MKRLALLALVACSDPPAQSAPARSPAPVVTVPMTVAAIDAGVAPTVTPAPLPTTRRTVVPLPGCLGTAVVLVLDRSGSMSGQPMEQAKKGASTLVDALGENDCFAAIAFDTAATTIVKLEMTVDKAPMKTAIAGITAGGGTDLLAALDAANDAMAAATKANHRLVILLTDGQSPTQGLRELAQSMVSEKITITTLGLGPSTDAQTLRMLSDTGGGRFYAVSDMTQLPRIFTRELQFLRK